jgi:hypothetical protein
VDVGSDFVERDHTQFLTRPPSLIFLELLFGTRTQHHLNFAVEMPVEYVPGLTVVPRFTHLLWVRGSEYW